MTSEKDEYDPEDLYKGDFSGVGDYDGIELKQKDDREEKAPERETRYESRLKKAVSTTRIVLADSYESSPLTIRILISAVVGELTFRLGSLLGGVFGVSVPVATGPEVPYSIRLLFGLFVGAYVLFEWIKLKQIADRDGFVGMVGGLSRGAEVKIKGGGVVGGAIVGGTSGSLFGLHGVVLGTTLGIAIGDELERRLSVLELSDESKRRSVDEIKDELQSIRKEVRRTRKSIEDTDYVTSRK